MRAGSLTGRSNGQTDFSEKSIQRDHSGDSRGKLTVIGTGPGEQEFLSRKAADALEKAEVVVGYKAYIELLVSLLEGKEIVSTGMTREVERCNNAIDWALRGKAVALVSSGDPGVYGMAGLALEIIERRKVADLIDFEVVPGITSATAAAALLGAPLMHDFAVISLSDLLTPWEIIKKRVDSAAGADFVMVLYNPASKKRTEQIVEVREIMLNHRNWQTPVGIVRNVSREGEEKVITNLGRMLENHIDMFTTIIIGNSRTAILGKYMVTPRGYSL